MKDSLYKSLALHVVIFLLLMIEIPSLFSHNDMTISQVPIIVDLNNVKISEMTNLPPKATFADEDRQASSTQQKVENFTQEPESEKQSNSKDDKTEATDDAKVNDAKPEELKDNFLTPPQPEKPDNKTHDKGKKNTEKFVKVQPKKPTPPKSKKDDKSPELANPLKSLLASVDQMEKNIGSTNQGATVKTGTIVNNMGVEGGVGGSYFSELTISETDAIAGRLRACWNLDPGAKGAQNMIVEIRAFLNQDGTVKEVKILDSSRYGSDPHFRSIAESARRAVYVCAPYTIFSEKYADKYDMWKTLLLRFNPLDGAIN